MKDYIINSLIKIAKISLIYELYLIGAFIAIGLLLEMIERENDNKIQKVFGWKGIIATGIIGTPIHEIGHAIMCIIFAHKIEELKLFRPISSSKDGVLGYVNHSYESRNVYQNIGNFFIAIGPIILGTIVMILSMKLLMPSLFLALSKHIISSVSTAKLYSNIPLILLSTFKLFVTNFFVVANMKNISFWIFVIITFSVSTHMCLSLADMKGAASGIVSLFLASMIISFITMILKISFTKYIAFFTKYNIYIIMFLSISLFISVISLAVIEMLYLLKCLIKK